MTERAEENRLSEGSIEIQSPELAITNNLFHSLGESICEGVIFFNLDGLILYSNPAAQLIFAPDGNLSGKNLSEFIAKDPFQEFLQQCSRADPLDHINFEFEVHTPAGDWHHVTLAGTRWPEPAAGTNGILGIVDCQIVQDIRQENAHPKEQHYRNIVEDQTDLIFRFHPNGTITYVNEAYCRFWNKERSDLVGTSLMAVIPKEDRPRIRAQFISLSTACPAVTYEARVCMPTGMIRWQQRTDRAIFDEKGQPVEFISVAHDITERKLAEAALKHQLAMEEIVMNISTRFINVAPAKIDREIHRALRQLGEFMDVDRCYIQVVQPDRRVIQKSYEWISSGSLVDFKQMHDDELERFQWVMGRLFHMEPVQVHNLDDLPAEAQVEKEFWSRLGIRSVLALPLTQGNQLVGFFGFDSARRESEWSEDEVGLLKVIGEIFVSVWMQKQSAEALLETQIQLNERIQELGNRTREINLLTEMSNMLQIASQFEETYLIVADYAARLFPGIGGTLWMIDPVTNSLSLKNQWGQGSTHAAILTAEDCWALRRGRLYQTSGEDPALFCRHIGQPLPSSSICIPIIMQGKTVGLLHFETPENKQPLNDAAQQLSAVTAEQVGLALSNLQLRQDLRDQAIRDALTGLYNRYYMEISLERELNRAARSLSPVSLMMLDIDHFRDINDRFSHAGGDRLLSELGKILRNTVRAEDIACRYGGEEFILILPDTPISIAQQRADQLRKDVKELSIWHEGQQLATITLSIGLTCWPQNARNVYDLIRSAESALERAKLAGRDQVITAD